MINASEARAVKLVGPSMPLVLPSAWVNVPPLPLIISRRAAAVQLRGEALAVGEAVAVVEVAGCGAGCASAFRIIAGTPTALARTAKAATEQTVMVRRRRRRRPRVVVSARERCAGGTPSARARRQGAFPA